MVTCQGILLAIVSRRRRIQTRRNQGLLGERVTGIEPAYPAWKAGRFDGGDLVQFTNALVNDNSLPPHGTARYR